MIAKYPMAGLVLIAALLCAILNPVPAWAAPKADLWPKWQQHDPSGTVRVDHSLWAEFLRKYLITDHPSGINRVRYAAVAPEDKAKLADYLDKLQATRVTALNRPEQKAFWINGYNALTVRIVLDNFPVASIRAIKPGGWFDSGPWKAKLLTIEGEALSLDDIEHRILRPIWRDNRVHYAVNCASIGCPNLQSEPFTADNTETLLETGAREYVNHPRGVRFRTNGDLTVSSIYDWFQEDFGGTEKGVLQHLIRYAKDPTAAKLRPFNGDIEYGYDWGLNAP